MKLGFEYLHATRGAGQELVLLHGWGSNREIWRPLLSELRRWANVTLVDMPGVAPGCGDEAPSIEALLEALLETAPAAATYIGWSLGGQLAIELAHRAPTRVSALVTLCSSPRFTVDAHWPGMDPGQLQDFSDACEQDPGQALRRFDSLQVAGTERPRPLLRALQALRSGEAGAALRGGLSWLAELDRRRELAGLGVPQLHLQASEDGLLPRELPDTLASLLADTPSAWIDTLPGTSHTAPLEASVAIAARVHAFLEEARLLQDRPLNDQALSKQDVAESFSRAARDYDSVAQLQRDVGERLLQQLASVPGSARRILDLGCGTGFFCPALAEHAPAAEYLGLDLAEGMVHYARDQYPGDQGWLVADAESLPLAAGSVDLVFSSLAIQWCQQPELLFAELARVLCPGGRCIFTSLGPSTLKELRAAWAAVDQHQHVNDFLPLERLQQAAAELPDVALTVRTEPFRMQYTQVRELLNELKTLGAHNVNRGRPAGLTGRRALQGMLRAYEDWRGDDGLLPASYEVYFGTLEKR